MNRLFSFVTLGLIAGCGSQMEPEAFSEPPIVEVYETCGATTAEERQTIDVFLDNIEQRILDGETRREVVDSLNADTQALDDWATLTPEEQQQSLLCISMSVDLALASR